MQWTKTQSDCKTYVEREIARIPLRWMARSKHSVLIDQHLTIEQTHVSRRKPAMVVKSVLGSLLRASDLPTRTTVRTAHQDGQRTAYLPSPCTNEVCKQAVSNEDDMASVYEDKSEL